MNKFLYLILLVCLLCSCSGDKKNNFNGSDITKAKINGNFSLFDQYGKNKTLADFKGDVVAIFFGFANCPDICPTTLVELKEIDKRINNKNFKVLGIDNDSRSYFFGSSASTKKTAYKLRSNLKNYLKLFKEQQYHHH